MRADGIEAWVAGELALALLAVDPDGLGGLHLRARAGPVRSAFLDALPPELGPVRRIAPGIDDVQLFGGTDIAATLAAGRVVRARGLLEGRGTLLLTMAERCGPGLAARLGQALDAGAAGPLLLLDEGVDEEAPPASLPERLAFSLDLDGLRAVSLAGIALDPGAVGEARTRLSGVALTADAIAALTVAAARLGIASLRAPLLALLAARAHAALTGKDTVDATDLQIAAQLVLAPRATCLPENLEDEVPPDTEPDGAENAPEDEAGEALPAELLIEAVRAILPPGLLAARQKAARSGRGTGHGAKRRGNRRGRPLPARPGRPSSEARIDVIATLRAAAPWQRLRREAAPERTGIIIRRSDLHVRRFREMSDRLVIFCVDASGSAALARMAEAKGAVELMLADAYSKRDHVALVAFRGEGAQLVLPPTRSLVQAKRRLAGLPGGGGTPLAAGLQAAHALAARAARQGMTPSLALLTDGRANVPLPGRTGRAAAEEDARRIAALLRACRVGGAVIDTGARPQRTLPELADRMGLPCLALPRADAGKLSAALAGALEG